MGPIKTEFVKFPKCDLIKNRLLIAIDGGNSLTKILFLNKKNKEQFLNKEEKVFTLDFCLFPNAEFESAIEWIKLNAFGLKDNCYSLHATGTFCLQNKDKIRSILNKEIMMIDEFLSIATGHKFALEHIGIENMLAKIVDVESYGEIGYKVFNKLTENIEAMFNKDEDALNKSPFYPSLIHVHGSYSGCIYLDENGICEYFGMGNHGGKNFLGLAKCVLDTNDYDEIVDLASRGDRINVDLQVKDLLSGDIESPYGTFPPEMPVFCLGKCTEYDKGREHFRKEDLALTLMSFHVQSIVTICNSLCLVKKISKVYLTGNLFNSDLFQSELKKYLNIFPVKIDFIFLNCGYCPALGAMLSSNDEHKTYIKTYQPNYPI